MALILIIFTIDGLVLMDQKDHRKFDENAR